MSDEQCRGAEKSKHMLFEALVRAQGLARAVHKDKDNSFHKYKYASSEALIAEGREALIEAGLALMPICQKIVRSDSTFKTKDKDETASVDNPLDVLRVDYMLCHESGESRMFESETPIIPEKGRPFDKAVAAARTYDLGYMLRGLLLLPRVGAGEEVDNRDDRNFDPSRLRSSQITDEMEDHLKALGKERYEKIVGAEPPDNYEQAVVTLELLRSERERDGLLRTIKMILREMGAKDAAGADALLTAKELPSLEAMTVLVKIEQLKEIAATLRKSWKGEA